MDSCGKYWKGSEKNSTVENLLSPPTSDASLRGNLLLDSLDDSHKQGHHSNSNTSDRNSCLHFLSNNANEGTEKQPEGNHQRRSNSNRCLARFVVDEDESCLRGVIEDISVSIDKSAKVLAERRASEECRELRAVLACCDQNLSGQGRRFGIFACGVDLVSSAHASTRCILILVMEALIR